MPTIELLAEVQALREQNRSLKMQIGVVLLDRDHWFERYKSAASDFQSLREENNEMRNLLHLTELDAEFWKDRAERATHMAALWKREAKKLHEQTMDDAMSMDSAYWEIDAGLQAKSELAALKKDARICADYVEHDYYFEETREAARRIIEATKEVE